MSLLPLLTGVALGTLRCQSWLPEVSVTVGHSRQL